MVKRIIQMSVVSLTLLSLTACMSEAEKIAMFRSQCAQFGFTPGTPAYAQCVQKQSIAYEKNQILQQQSGALNTIANK